MPLQIINHPLIQHKMALLRDAGTPPFLFRALIEEITFLLAYEATKNLKLTAKKIQTPLEETAANKITSPVVILPILRAALGMVDPFLKLIPWASVGHMGAYRDENTLQPHVYYFKIPIVTPEQEYFICDPMLATGGTVSATITYKKISEFRDDYLRHIDNLSAAITSLSGNISCRREKEVMHNATIDASDEHEAIEINEILTNKVYQETLAFNFPIAIKVIIEANYADEKRHLAYIRNTLLAFVN